MSHQYEEISGASVERAVNTQANGFVDYFVRDITHCRDITQSTHLYNNSYCREFFSLKPLVGSTVSEGNPEKKEIMAPVESSGALQCVGVLDRRRHSLNIC